MSGFNNKLRQVFFFVLILALGALLFSQLYTFFPGFLGALTLYILSRKWYFKLTFSKKWNKSATALLFMFAFVTCIVVPIYFSVQLVYSKIEHFLKNPDQIYSALNAVSNQIKDWTGQDISQSDFVKELPKRVAGFVPMLLNSSATLIGNLLMILFLSFFMFTNGPQLERAVSKFLPLRNENIDMLAQETKMMVKANALGIPIISIVQGLVAMIGYWIFGMKDFVLLGFLTGIFAFFPVIGTAAIWIPSAIFLFSSGENGKAIGLAIYSAVVTGNIDYLARISFLKKVGDVHPVITILGLIVGLKLFGFLGFIFGPLLISYFLLLLKIYTTEFGKESSAAEYDKVLEP
ncbi:AI-2E family transporter [Dyadobacter subterraneus]|uniref:AI-2E family transporter n=1 Tax=Dyadobacter subterraneus TaxID=2773304 RepID=A0ABR9WFH8_9BACT|nr:AI-2E family transporter [Dyadobacter subterraneus]MBE9464264.1 AI-2E family transporter [Dyadobacter subterraneus]